LPSGCGSSGRHATPTTTAGPPPTTAPPATAAAPTPSQTTASALQAEANSAAAGDVPDNQVYVVFHDVAAGYSIKYPEGWAQKGAGSAVTFRDKNNVVRIVVAPRRPVIAGAVRSSLRGAQVTSGPAALRIGGALEFHDVFKIYRSGPAETVALRGLDLRVEPREIVAVFGPSGSGKSSALHLAAGLDEPSAGEVRALGRSLSRLDESELAAYRA